jgi:hypothetical protein
MKKLLILAVFIFLVMSTGAFTQEDEGAVPKTADGQTFLLFSEGATCSWLTRIIKQTGRSNFVFEDFLPGLYFRTDLRTKTIFTPMVKIAALYPAVSTFNKFPQLPNIPLHFGADINLGLNFDIFDFKYVRLNAGPALHMLFLNSERWNYFEMGGALLVGMDLPLTRRWTIICNGFASLDNGNLGGNGTMEPFDIAYQYQLDIGVRYSKKLENSTSLFPGKIKVQEAPFLSR